MIERPDLRKFVSLGKAIVSFILAPGLQDWAKEAIEKMLTVGSFPEPLLDGSQTFYNRWKRSHLDIILRQDLLDLENTTNIVKIESLIELLKKRVSKIVSRESLATALEVSPHTVKSWLTILENLFVFFPVSTWSSSVQKSLLKAKKYYFYDIGQVDGDRGAKWDDSTPDSNFKAFNDFKSIPEYVQLIGQHVAERETNFGLKIRYAGDWLSEFCL